MSFFSLVTRADLNAAVKQLQKEMRQMEASQQADVDALTTAVNQVSTDVENARTALQTEIDSLAAAHPSVDLSALQAAVAPLDGAVQSLSSLTPTPSGTAAPADPSAPTS
jgi:uncharacterized protein YlxW (UPF0749 family)